MTTTNPSDREVIPTPLLWLIAADGIFTVVGCLVIAPVGIGLVLANAVAAVVARGRKRRAFAVIAIVGAVVLGVMALLLTGTTGAIDVGPTTPS